MKIRNLLIDVTMHSPKAGEAKARAAALAKRLDERLGGVADWQDEMWHSPGRVSFDGEVEFPGRIKDGDMAAKIGEIVTSVVPDEDGAVIVLLSDPEE